jgi:ABC-2 type transport system permease protein
VFFFDWILGCLSFYIIEIWGLSMVRYGVGLFFSGLLIPLVMMPDWLQRVVSAVPLAQALYVPISLLSGITPVSEAPRILLTQVIWLIGLGVLSRLVFSIAVRKVTVQGG